MRIYPGFCVAAAAVALGSGASRAEVFVRAPFVTVHVGQPGVYVGVFGRPVAVVPRVPGPPPRRLKASRQSAELLPAPRPLTEIDDPVPTVSQFLESFKPHTGKHD